MEDIGKIPDLLGILFFSILNCGIMTLHSRLNAKSNFLLELFISNFTVFLRPCFDISVNGRISNVLLNYEDEKRYEDDVEATVAILKGHEHEHGLTVGQVLLRDVHLYGVYDQENDGETYNENGLD